MSFFLIHFPNCLDTIFNSFFTAYLPRLVVNIFYVMQLPGKILDDNKALSEYKIEEGKFIVAMVTKVCVLLASFFMLV